MEMEVNGNSHIIHIERPGGGKSYIHGQLVVNLAKVGDAAFAVDLSTRTKPFSGPDEELLFITIPADEEKDYILTVIDPSSFPWQRIYHGPISNIRKSFEVPLPPVPPAIFGTAQWQKIGGSSGVTTSADVSSIKRDGDLVELWTLWDYDKPQVVDGPKFLSVKQKAMYDCADHTTAITEYTTYAKNGGLGTIVFHRSKPPLFEPAKPGSAADGVFQFACTRTPGH
jgi:hypothetical protein